MSALTGKVALIHGAGREPARTIARTLAAEGAAVALVDLTPMVIQEEAMALAAAGAQASFHIADPSKSLAARLLLDEVLERWGQVDILVLHPRAAPNKPLLELDEWDWQRALESNLSAPFLLMQMLGTWLARRQRPGIFISLLSGANPNDVAFNAGQMGLRGLNQAVAPEFAELNIRLYTLAMQDDLPATLAQAAQMAVWLSQDGCLAGPGSTFDLPASEEFIS